MARSRRLKSSARFQIEGLETRALLSSASPTAEIAPISVPESVDVPISTPASPDDVMFYTTGSPTPVSVPTRMTPALRRAQRMAQRWEAQDAAGPHVTDTTLLTRGDQIVGFALTFDSPMRADITTDPRAYRAIRITQQNEWISRLTYQSSGPQIEELPIRAVEYHADDQTAVLWLKDPRRATGKFRVGVVTGESARPRGVRTLALGPLTDTSGRRVQRHPSDVQFPGRNVLFVQPDRSAPFDSARFTKE